MKALCSEGSFCLVSSQFVPGACWSQPPHQSIFFAALRKACLSLGLMCDVWHDACRDVPRGCKLMEGFHRHQQTLASPLRQGLHHCRLACLPDLVACCAGTCAVWGGKSLDAGEPVPASHHGPLRAARPCRGPRARARRAQEPAQPDIATFKGGALTL